MLPQNIKKKKGNFIVMISLFLVWLAMFFWMLSSIVQLYKRGQENNRKNLYAIYAAESVLERLPYEYNENNHLGEAKTILFSDEDAQESFCKRHDFDFDFDADSDDQLTQAIMDFGVNCKNWSNSIEIWGWENKSIIKKHATRMVDEETGYLDRHQFFEYRLTQSEFLEKNGNSDYTKPAKLEITWSAETTKNNLDLEIIIASWDKVGDKISTNINVHRLQLDSINSPYELRDLSTKDTWVLDLSTKEYIVFIHSLDKPINFSIKGYTAGDWDIKIPSRNLYLKVSSFLENEQDNSKNFTHTVEAIKPFYTDFDSEFPYAEYHIFE